MRALAELKDARSSEGKRVTYSHLLSLRHRAGKKGVEGGSKNREGAVMRLAVTAPMKTEAGDKG
jgi:hypothetical protein